MMKQGYILGGILKMAPNLHCHLEAQGHQLRIWDKLRPWLLELQVKAKDEDHIWFCPLMGYMP